MTGKIEGLGGDLVVEGRGKRVFVLHWGVLVFYIVSDVVVEGFRGRFF